MADIVPRWEWRSFGRCFGDAESKLAKITPSGVQDSDEIYLLSGAGGNVKIRDALVDIKLKREVNANGLEQWTPVMKAGFPLPVAEVTKVQEALDVPIAEARRSSYTLEELLDHLVAQGNGVRVVKVHKQRTRYTVDSCMAEISHVTANGKPTRTIAVESTDAASVIRIVTDLGLGGYTNTCYPRGLAALIDGEPERYAVIDVGTNSVKLHIGERGTGRKWSDLVDRAELTRLGEGLSEKGTISDAALARTTTAISSMVDEARRSGVRAIAAVGTAGLRIAANGPEIVAALKARVGIEVEVISGEEEARLAYRAAMAGLGLKAGSLVVFDTGGGSSQFTFGHGSNVDDRFSIDAGAARYTAQYKLDGAVTAGVVQEAMSAISTDLSRIENRPTPDELVGMGGAITNITAVKLGLATYDPRMIQGTVLDRAEIDRQIELYRSRSADARRAIIGLQPKRAEVILAGACIVRTIMEKLGKNSLTVSDRGLRHGVLAERFDA